MISRLITFFFITGLISLTAALVVPLWFLAFQVFVSEQVTMQFFAFTLAYGFTAMLLGFILIVFEY